MTTIARFYDESKNPDGGAIPGVPLGDMTEEEFDALPEWLQRSVDASPMYRKTRPSGKAKERTPADDIAFTPAPALERDMNKEN